MHPSTVFLTKDATMSFEDLTVTLVSRPAPARGCSAKLAVAPEPAPSTPPALASNRWSDYDDDDDDWIPEILLPKPAETQCPSQPEEEPQSSEIGGGEEEIPDDGIWFDERFGQYMYGGEPISYINGDLVTPQEWIQNPHFEGYWQDKVTKRVHLYCQNRLGLAVHSDGQSKWLNDNYYWARHPMTAPMSKYELLTMEFNSVAPNPTRRGGPSRGKAEWVRGVATRALRIPVAAPCDTPPAEGFIAEEADDSTPPVAGAEAPPEPQPTAVATEAPSPRPPEGPVQMTPLEFLISRGLYKNGRPPPPRPVVGGPVKSLLQGPRSSWASKLRSPVRSLRTAYRKAGDKIANKVAVFLGAC
ncbi:uncharacterized protein DFL_004532 [Arthrobotrys flagrans]|uniref:Uncharacterized protein n=1 Tax=Arthrobotrys flagrans TaxID=97331 RepID=A0A437A572_ARTFL|nr:hypothetical protein DFL_004532 [Arthrobotrys flagrans]